MRRTVGSLILMALLSAAPVAGQGGMMMAPPEFRGVLNPVVGSGAAYEVEGGRAGKSEIEIAVVGKEAVNGKDGFWLQIGTNSPSADGQMYMKTLSVIDGNVATVTRIIIQPPGSGPMELPVGGMMGGRGGPQPMSTDARQQAERVGTETITTPAGQFNCEHYRAKDGSWDAWISPQVTPWGLVKSTTRDTTMVLSRVITNAQDRITGTPQRFDPSQMMRGMGRGGQ